MPKKNLVLKMARENAPKMLQNYKEQKRIIQQKHIEILQKKKDGALSSETAILEMDILAKILKFESS
jgi:hypothetical protein